MKFKKINKSAKIYKSYQKEKITITISQISFATLIYSKIFWERKKLSDKSNGVFKMCKTRCQWLQSELFLYD